MEQVQNLRETVVMSQFVPFATDNLYDVAVIRVLLKVDQDPCAHIQTLSHTCMPNTHVYMHTLGYVRTPICLGTLGTLHSHSTCTQMYSHRCIAHAHSTYTLICTQMYYQCIAHTQHTLIHTHMYSHQCIAHTQHMQADMHSNVFSSVH